jgi:hypothetical protein
VEVHLAAVTARPGGLLIVVVGNLIVDVLYAVLDPRAGREPTLNRDKSLAGGVI